MASSGGTRPESSDPTKGAYTALGDGRYAGVERPAAAKLAFPGYCQSRRRS